MDTNDAPGESLCENMNSFFQTASKDKHNLEVKYPLSCAAKNDISPSVTHLHLSHDGNMLGTTYLQSLLSVKAQVMVQS